EAKRGIDSDLASDPMTFVDKILDREARPKMHAVVLDEFERLKHALRCDSFGRSSTLICSSRARISRTCSRIDSTGWCRFACTASSRAKALFAKFYIHNQPWIGCHFLPFSYILKHGRFASVPGVR